MFENDEKYTIFRHLSFINSKNIAPIQKKLIFANKNNEFLGLITTNTIRLMIRNLLYMMFSMTLLLGAPVSANANNAIEIVDNDIVGITVTVSESTLRVTGATGLTLSIYNVAGVHVQSFRVEGADRRYELNLPKGCYIVKVGKVVRKISIK